MKTRSVLVVALAIGGVVLGEAHAESPGVPSAPSEVRELRKLLDQPLGGGVPAEGGGFRSDPDFPLGPLPTELRATEPPRAAAPPIRRIEIVPTAPAEPAAAPPLAAPVTAPEGAVEPRSAARARPPRREPRPLVTRPGPESVPRPPAPAIAAVPPPPPQPAPVILVAPPEPGLQPLGDGSGVWYYRDQGSEFGRPRRR